MEKTKRKTGGIAKFIEEAKRYRDDPTVLNNIIEAMSEKIDELQAKATAYDRLMSGGKKTIQEYIAKYWDKQVIDFVVRLDGEDSFYIHPALESGDTFNFKAKGNCLETIWEDTLPDKWEDAK